MEYIHIINKTILNITNQLNSADFFKDICIPGYLGVLSIFIFLIPLSLNFIDSIAKQSFSENNIKYIGTKIGIFKLYYIISFNLCLFLVHIAVYNYAGSYTLTIFNNIFIFSLSLSIIYSIIFTFLILQYSFNSIKFIITMLSHKNKNIEELLFNYLTNRYKYLLEKKNTYFKHRHVYKNITNDLKIISKDISNIFKYNSKRKGTNNNWTSVFNAFTEINLRIQDHNTLSLFISSNIDIISSIKETKYIKSRHLEYALFYSMYVVANKNYKKEENLKLLEASLYGIEHYNCKDIIQEKFQFIQFKIIYNSAAMLLKSINGRNEDKFEILLRHFKAIKRSVSPNYKISQVSRSMYFDLRTISSNDFHESPEVLDLVFTNYYFDTLLSIILYNQKVNDSTFNNKLLDLYNSGLNDPCKIWSSIIRLKSYTHDNKLSPIELINDHKLNQNITSKYDIWNANLSSMYDLRDFKLEVLNLLNESSNSLFSINTLNQNNQLDDIINNQLLRENLQYFLSELINYDKDSDKEAIKQAKEIRDYLRSKYNEALKNEEIKNLTVNYAFKQVKELLESSLKSLPIWGELKFNTSDKKLENMLFSMKIDKNNCLEVLNPLSNGIELTKSVASSSYIKYILDSLVQKILFDSIIKYTYTLKAIVFKNKEGFVEELKKSLTTINNPIILINNINHQCEYIYQLMDNYEPLKETEIFINKTYSDSNNGLEYLSSINIDKNIKADIFFSRVVSYKEDDENSPNDEIIILSKDVFKSFYYNIDDKPMDEIITEDKDENKVKFNLEIEYQLNTDSIDNKNCIILKYESK
jgi:hypothetical protein